MGTVKRPYGPWSKEMLEGLREAGVLKVEALVEWLASRGTTVDRTLVSHWGAGRSHLPADVLVLLSEFTERPELVWSGKVKRYALWGPGRRNSIPPTISWHSPAAR